MVVDRWCFRIYLLVLVRLVANALQLAGITSFNRGGETARMCLRHLSASFTAFLAELPFTIVCFDPSSTVGVGCWVWTGTGGFRANAGGLPHRSRVSVSVGERAVPTRRPRGELCSSFRRRRLMFRREERTTCLGSPRALPARRPASPPPRFLLGRARTESW